LPQKFAEFIRGSKGKARRQVKRRARVWKQIRFAQKFLANGRRSFDFLSNKSRMYKLAAGTCRGEPNWKNLLGVRWCDESRLRSRANRMVRAQAGPLIDQPAIYDVGSSTASFECKPRPISLKSTPTNGCCGAALPISAVRTPEPQPGVEESWKLAERNDSASPMPADVKIVQPFLPVFQVDGFLLRIVSVIAASTACRKELPGAFEKRRSVRINGKPSSIGKLETASFATGESDERFRRLYASVHQARAGRKRDNTNPTATTCVSEVLRTNAGRAAWVSMLCREILLLEGQGNLDGVNDGRRKTGLGSGS